MAYIRSLCILLAMVAVATATIREVYVIPHSHDDVGYRDSADQYYDEKLHSMYDTMVEALSKNTTRRFIAVEMYFVHKWWNDATTTEAQRDAFTQLVKNKQLEIVNGGWVMHDATVTCYDSDIQQMTIGHRFVADILGEDVRPRFGWHIDPFGESAVTPSHFALMGFNGFVNSRIPYLEKEEMAKEKKLEYVWRGSPSLGESAGMMTHTLDKFSYGSILVFDHPWVPPVDDLTKLAYATDLIVTIDEREPWYKAPIMYPWGNDFEFYDANKMFDNMDKLMAFVNRHPQEFRVHLRYATLSEYFEALHAMNETWPTRGSEDFYPYDNKKDRYWTGFYTSRPLLKVLAREAQRHIAAAERCFTISRAAGALLELSDYALLDTARQQHAVAMHHDAITGTSNDWVQDDYDNRVHEAMKAADTVLLDTAPHLVTPTTTTTLAELSMDASILSTAAVGTAVPVVLYNTLAWSQDVFIHVPVSSEHFTVVDAEYKAVESQVTPSFNASGPAYLLYFRAKIPPVGFTTVFIEKLAGFSSREGMPAPSSIYTLTAETTVANAQYSLTFSDAGFLTSVTLLDTNQTSVFAQQLMEYDSGGGIEVKSDPWVFHPKGPAEAIADHAEVVVVEGPYVQVIHQRFSATYEQTIRLYSCSDSSACEPGRLIEMENTVGPMGDNREAISRISTDLDTEGILYTDANDFQTQQRTYKPTIVDPIAGNYYPMTAAAYLQEESSDMQWTVVSGSAHGVASLKPGEMEIMLHRKPMYHDPDMVAKDNSTVTVHFWMHLGPIQDSLRWRHHASHQLRFAPTLFFGKAFASPGDYGTQYTLQSSAVNALPFNVHLMSLDATEFQADSPVVLRLVHLFAVGEDPEYSQPVAVDIDALFAGFNATKIEERSLSTIWPIDDLVRWDWNTERGPSNGTPSQAHPLRGSTITIAPHEIRTFFVHLEAVGSPGFAAM